MKVVALCALVLFVSYCYCGGPAIFTSNYEDLTSYVFSTESTYSVSYFVSTLTYSIPSIFSSELEKDVQMYNFNSVENGSGVLSASLMLLLSVLFF